MNSIIESAKKLCDELNATFLYIITDDAKFIDSMLQAQPDIKTIIATCDPKIQKLLRDKEISVKKLSREPLKGRNRHHEPGKGTSCICLG
jgi:hypothetical protein